MPGLLVAMVGCWLIDFADSSIRDCPIPACDGGRVVKGNPNGNTGGYTLRVAKVMVSLPDDLLAEFDAEVKRRSTTRSALLAIAARRELARQDPAALAAAIERSERRFRAAGSFESAGLIRSDRENRR